MDVLSGDYDTQAGNLMYLESIKLFGRRNWISRYATISNDKLILSNDERAFQNGDHLYEIELYRVDIVERTSIDGSSKQNIFRIKTRFDNKEYYFSCYSPVDSLIWITTLEKCILTSKDNVKSQHVNIDDEGFVDADAGIEILSEDGNDGYLKVTQKSTCDFILTLHLENTNSQLTVNKLATCWDILKAICPTKSQNNHDGMNSCRTCTLRKLYAVNKHGQIIYVGRSETVYHYFKVKCRFYITNVAKKILVVHFLDDTFATYFVDRNVTSKKAVKIVQSMNDIYQENMGDVGLFFRNDTSMLFCDDDKNPLSYLYDEYYEPNSKNGKLFVMPLEYLYSDISSAVKDCKTNSNISEKSEKSEKSENRNGISGKTGSCTSTLNSGVDFPSLVDCHFENKNNSEEDIAPKRHDILVTRIIKRNKENRKEKSSSLNTQVGSSYGDNKLNGDKDKSKADNLIKDSTLFSRNYTSYTKTQIHSNRDNNSRTNTNKEVEFSNGDKKHNGDSSRENNSRSDTVGLNSEEIKHKIKKSSISQDFMCHKCIMIVNIRPLVVKTKEQFISIIQDINPTNNYICLSGFHLRYGDGDKSWILEDETEVLYDGDNNTNENHEIVLNAGGLVFIWVYGDEMRPDYWLIKRAINSQGMDTDQKKKNHNLLKYESLSELLVGEKKDTTSDCSVNVIKRTKQELVKTIKGATSKTFSLTKLPQFLNEDPKEENTVKHVDTTAPLTVEAYRQMYINPLKKAASDIWNHFEYSNEETRQLGDDAETPVIGWLVRGPLCQAIADLLSHRVAKKPSLFKTMFGDRLTLWTLVCDMTLSFNMERFSQIVAFVSANKNLRDDEMKFRFFICELLNRKSINCLDNSNNGLDESKNLDNSNSLDKPLITWFRCLKRQDGKLVQYYDETAFMCMHESKMLDLYEELVQGLMLLNGKQFFLHDYFESQHTIK